MSNAASSPALSPAANFSLPLCHLSCVPAFAVSLSGGSQLYSFSPNWQGSRALGTLPCTFLAVSGPSWSAVAAECFLLTSLVCTCRRGQKGAGFSPECRAPGVSL